MVQLPVVFEVFTGLQRPYHDNFPDYFCFSIPRSQFSASQAPPALPRPHARATHARGLIVETTGHMRAKLGERGGIEKRLGDGLDRSPLLLLLLLF